MIKKFGLSVHTPEGKDATKFTWTILGEGGVIRKLILIVGIPFFIHYFCTKSSAVTIDPCESKLLIYGNGKMSYGPEDKVSPPSTGPCFEFKSKKDFLDSLTGKNGPEQTKKAIADVAPLLKSHSLTSLDPQKSKMEKLELKILNEEEVNLSAIIEEFSKMRPSQYQYYLERSQQTETIFWYTEIGLQPNLKKMNDTFEQRRTYQEIIKNLKSSDEKNTDKIENIKKYIDAFDITLEAMKNAERKYGFEVDTQRISDSSWEYLVSHFPQLKEAILKSGKELKNTKKENAKQLEETNLAVGEFVKLYEKSSPQEKQKLEKILSEILINAAADCQFNIVSAITQANILPNYDTIVGKALLPAMNTWEQYYNAQEESKITLDQIRNRCENTMETLFSAASIKTQGEFMLGVGEMLYESLQTGNFSSLPLGEQTNPDDTTRKDQQKARSSPFEIKKSQHYEGPGNSFYPATPVANELQSPASDSESSESTSNTEATSKNLR